MEFEVGKVGQSMECASFPTELSNTAEVLRTVISGISRISGAERC
jgi:hypothetical protein